MAIYNYMALTSKAWIYMYDTVFAGWEVLMVKNSDQGLERLLLWGEGGSSGKGKISLYSNPWHVLDF